MLLKYRRNCVDASYVKFKLCYNYFSPASTPVCYLCFAHAHTGPPQVPRLSVVVAADGGPG